MDDIDRQVSRAIWHYSQPTSFGRLFNLHSGQCVFVSLILLAISLACNHMYVLLLKPKEKELELKRARERERLNQIMPAASF